jgi:hypothetical protein
VDADVDFVAALRARLAAAAASGWGTPSPSDARQQAEALRRWRAEHPEPERDEVEGTDTAKPERRRRQRKPRVPAQFDKAIKAGLPARLERRPDGTVIVEIGHVEAANIGEPDPWERAMQGPKQ